TARAVALLRTGQGELAQVAHLGPPGGQRERRQRRGDQADREGQLGTEPGRHLDRTGPAGEALGHLRAGAQLLVGPGRQPAVELVEAAPGPHRRQRGGEPAPRLVVVVRAGGRDDRQLLGGRKLGEGVVALVGEWVAREAELDVDAVAAEPRDEVLQRTAARGEVDRGRPAVLHRGSYRPLAAAGEHQPPPGGQVGELVEVVDR